MYEQCASSVQAEQCTSCVRDLGNVRVAHSCYLFSVKFTKAVEAQQVREYEQGMNSERAVYKQSSVRAVYEICKMEQVVVGFTNGVEAKQVRKYKKGVSVGQAVYKQSSVLAVYEQCTSGAQASF